ncbi:serine-rich coiled-coil domain-containing protein 2 isoform X2 [Erpetoichthys calabaricus]|uniref:serine-rich coiled-coil domain-containing protein 2 isoform X2 n=1 Tax=Erpetoichthys calabaricus TaxID=27687 RepID=UPI002234D3C1|nr:serine-rich coiled-coil domain-containing protein 2 isoform X2 [Erpetoichthys calabaricus]
MEEKLLNKTISVSRLPKFGAKIPGSSDLLNGSCAVAATSTLSAKSDERASGYRQNGIPRVLSLSVGYRKNSKMPMGCQSYKDDTEMRDNEKELNGIGLQSLPSKHEHSENKKVISSAASKRKNAFTLSAKNEASSKTLSETSSSANKTSIPSRTLSMQNFNSKSTINAVNNVSGVKNGTGLQRPRANLSTTRSSSKESLTQSNDNLKNGSVESMVRSQSFSHFKRIPSSNGISMTRSYSFNKAVDLSKPSRGLQLRTKSFSAKTAQRVKTVTDMQKEVNVKGSLSKCASDLGSDSNASSPLTSLKNTFLSGSAIGKIGAQSYKMTRPSLIKFSRPTVSKNIAEDGVHNIPLVRTTETAPLTSDEKCPVDIKATECTTLKEQVSNLRHLEQTLDEMSLSSSSSLEAHDLSEGYLDDFDNLGDGGGFLVTEYKGNFLQMSHAPEQLPKCVRTEGDMLNTVSETMEWIDIGFQAGHGEEMDSSQTPLQTATPFSPDMNFPVGSSLELSPSDSSGGTYMWDEEGMEPLGTNAHHCGSYDNSEINSLDILNNLDNLGPCDLDDDDLMLDVELPDDGSLHNVEADNMAHFDQMERSNRQGFWGRRPQRWAGRQDHYGTSTEHFSHDNSTVALDELTLQLMTQDCTSVKLQLQRLKKLLQVDDDSSVKENLVSESKNLVPEEETAQKVEELMSEIRSLRQELKKKDETIKQLQQQMATRCQCQRRTQGCKSEKKTYGDKFTQTSWRAPSGGLPSPFFSPWQGSFQGIPRYGAPQRRQRVERLVHYFCDKACLEYYSLSAQFTKTPKTRKD